MADQQGDDGGDGWGAPQPDEAEIRTVAELTALDEAATALRDRIRSPERYPRPFPQEVTLLMVAGLLETIARAGPSPTADRWRSVVDAADEIARHVGRNGPITRPTPSA